MSSKTQSQVIVTVFFGQLVNPKSLLDFDVFPSAALAVGSNGDILFMKQHVEEKHLQSLIDSELRKHCISLTESGLILHTRIKKLSEDQFIMPGFVDTHTHAPQVPNLGSGGQYELLQWLEYVTFPMEAKFKEVNFAREQYPKVVKRFIDFGTTTCCYYGTLHLEATKILAEEVIKQGQRAFVGKCNMNREGGKDYQEPSTEESIKTTKELITYIRSLPGDLVKPILTPRFAISCTDDLLSALGDMARKDDTLAIQTHISENRGEIEYIKKLFPDSSSYADVYYKNGLLTERTILAHGVWLTDDELKLIKQSGSGVSHCPTSNFNLSSGMARVGEMLDREIKVGLGTDVSGGYSPSMLNAIQHASICSKMVAVQSTGATDAPKPDSQFANKQLKIASLLYLATMGGASLCCLDEKIGSFAPGKSFDALLVDVSSQTQNPSIWYGYENGKNSSTGCSSSDLGNKEDRLKTMLERFLFGGDDRNIVNVFVQGRCIKGSI